MPLRDGLTFAHNALVGIGLRDRIKLGASGKIASAFDIARAMALGADWCNSARGFMFALGCIQSLSCHTDRCPTGVATQDPTRQRALVVPDKLERVANFHASTMHSLAELTAAAGLDHPRDQPYHFSRRVSGNEVMTFSELYPSLESGNYWGTRTYDFEPPGTWPPSDWSSTASPRAKCFDRYDGEAIISLNDDRSWLVRIVNGIRVDRRLPSLATIPAYINHLRLSQPPHRLVDQGDAFGELPGRR